jgi:NAD-dependent SIR2 family protein deacetylase
MSKIRKAAEAIRNSSAILVSAGAGMGVDSGLPDFRGNDGFWRAYPAFERLGLSFYDLANPKWFREDALQAWGFYGHRYRLYRSTSPHEGFGILRNWCQQKQHKYFVFTSNVDGHFQSAAFDDHRVLECHGSFASLQCSVPCCDSIWNYSELSVVIDENTMRALPPVPECPACQSVARPNILMFGDWDWIDERFQSQLARYSDWLRSIPAGELVVIEIGAGSAVPTVRAQSEQIVRQKSATLIRVNPRESQGPAGTISIERTGLAAIRAIDDCLQSD